MRVLTVIGTLGSSILSAGCGCGDAFATRKLVLTELWGISADSVRVQPFQIDTSAMPAGTVKRTDKTGMCGSPISELELSPKGGVKIIIVPADEP